ncbi:hypothetical protein RJT34_16696 [Clitoria ternatea]|uniref:Uncharacterized protein n=1 Tax=Clitoria ternatea TaxID=43366 RepID=A0AAN9J973_CLITE
MRLLLREKSETEREREKSETAMREKSPDYASFVPGRGAGRGWVLGWGAYENGGCGALQVLVWYLVKVEVGYMDAVHVKIRVVVHVLAVVVEHVQVAE